MSVDFHGLNVKPEVNDIAVIEFKIEHIPLTFVHYELPEYNNVKLFG
ncbi:hypothetical protein LLG07_01500 [bacterium]|nr:hypothetical protein [bacterium]